MDWVQRIFDRWNKTTPKALRAVKGMLHEEITKLDEAQIANAHEAIGCRATGDVLADEAFDLAEAGRRAANRSGDYDAAQLRDIAKWALVASHLLEREQDAQKGRV